MSTFSTGQKKQEAAIPQEDKKLQPLFKKNQPPLSNYETVTWYQHFCPRLLTTITDFQKIPKDQEEENPKTSALRKDTLFCSSYLSSTVVPLFRVVFKNWQSLKRPEEKWWLLHVYQSAQQKRTQEHSAFWISLFAIIYI